MVSSWKLEISVVASTTTAMAAILWIPCWAGALLHCNHRGLVLSADPLHFSQMSSLIWWGGEVGWWRHNRHLIQSENFYLLPSPSAFFFFLWFNAHIPAYLCTLYIYNLFSYCGSSITHLYTSSISTLGEPCNVLAVLLQLDSQVSGSASTFSPPHINKCIPYLICICVWFHYVYIQWSLL